MRSSCLGRVLGEGHAQVDTALLADLDMHGEADETEKKARGCCVGVGVGMCRPSASDECAERRRRVIRVSRSGGARSGALHLLWQGVW